MSSIIKPTLGSQLQIGHRLARGPVGFWPFNEGSGGQVFDLSGNGLIGTLIGTAPTWTPGKFGPVINLPATDEHIALVDSAVVPSQFQGIGNSNNYTIVVWIKTSAAPSTDELYWWGEDVIIELRTETSSGTHCPFSLAVEDTFIVFGRTPNHTISDEREIGTVAINDGIWHQVAVSIVNNTVDFYVDGVLDVQRTFTTAIGDCSVGATASNLQIGARTGNVGNYDEFFEGSVDLPTIYNRALTASEIALLYREPFCMFERELIELWAAATQGVAGINIPLVMQQMNHFNGGMAA